MKFVAIKSDLEQENNYSYWKNEMELIEIIAESLYNQKSNHICSIANRRFCLFGCHS